ncbi:glutamine amidotransferase subunit pdxT [Cylindrobasidium torrendii FP15055 ss-10]|uniref:glutaminase n=1 Tax=Cylindrobasidium torrendii FP15055 ss-10 TaxID=1314674 RepID=A0A0D7B8J0_9AGAR|nr:glutamine amidotransferase subunit pdxT [Cylindrobasidium torrendii FP15055 ss-10]
MASQQVIGVLALQGAFAEHVNALKRLPMSARPRTLLVRTPAELEQCTALIIPGGESTTMALVAHRSGLLEPLRAFVKTRPVWGTCAGAILLSEEVVSTKQGGQELIGGIEVKTARNGWGSQIESFEAPLRIQGMDDSKRQFVAVFIRAPVVLELKGSANGPPIEVLARLPLHLLPPALSTMDPSDPRTIVALRQGKHLLTTFHPELTKDDRFHDFFVRHCVLADAQAP